MAALSTQPDGEVYFDFVGAPVKKDPPRHPLCEKHTPGWSSGGSSGHPPNVTVKSIIPRESENVWMLVPVCPIQPK